MAAYLRVRGGLSVPGSHRVARRAARLAAWPEITEAWTAGELHGAKVEVVCAKVPARHVDRFAGIAGGAGEIFAALTVDEVRRKLDDWVTDADSEAEREAAEAADEVGAEVPVKTVPEREM